MTETPLPLLQARLSEITHELLRRGISIEEQCSRLGLANAEELEGLLGDAR
jgi:hypothetical protein